jgi:hypothetical protein
MLSFRLQILFFILGIAIATAFQTPGVQAQNDIAKTKIGIFDSRAVGLAYGRSEAFRNGMIKLHERHAEAKKSGDEEAMKEMEAEGQATQDLLHKQVFGTYSVAKILAAKKDEVTAIAQKAGVVVVVSKWDLTYQAQGYEFVDLSLPLAMLFNPSEETLKIIEEIKTQEPVPLEELKHDHSH